MADTEELLEFAKNLRRAAREVDSLFRERTDCCGVTPAQCQVLLELGEASTSGAAAAAGSMTLAALAESVRLDNSTLSRTVELLVQAGLVSRTVNPKNRRSVVLELTAKGKTRVARLNHDCAAFFRKVLRAWPDEKKDRLLTGAALLTEFFRQWRQAPPPPSPGCCSSSVQGGAR